MKGVSHRTMRIISRLIFRELLGYFLLALLVFTFVLFLGRIFQLTELVVNKGVPFLVILRLLLVISPSFFLVTIPMALLLATVMTFSRMSADSEIIAMKATGISLYRQLAPVLLLSVLSYGASNYLIFYALPWSERSFMELRLELANSQAASISVKARVFNDDFDGLVLYVHEMPSTERVMRGILISDNRSQENPQTIVAEEGVLIPDPETSRITLRLRAGAIHRPVPQEEKYQVINFETYDLSLEARDLLGDAGKLERVGKNLSLYEIQEKLKRYGPEDRRYNGLLVEYYKKFSIPFATLILGFLGAPLGIKNTRSGKSGSFALSLFIIIFYYVFLTLGEGLGERAVVPIATALWFPNMVLGAIAIYAVTKVGRETPFKTFNWIGERLETVWESFCDRLRARGLLWTEEEDP